MKLSKNTIIARTHAIPKISFEQQSLTSYSGLVLLQLFFEKISLKARLRSVVGCTSRCYGLHTIMLVLITHCILGFKRMRHISSYAHDPLVKRFVGLRSLPDVATISRTLSAATLQDFTNLRDLNRQIVFDDILAQKLSRITLDFDGSVLSTKGSAEATAVGFNKKRKGARSYYPNFCTIAQSGQVVDFLFRSGNVHDSHGVKEFAVGLVRKVRSITSATAIETRMDSAFFSEEMVGALAGNKVEFTISVPFYRLTELKAIVQSRKRWNSVNDTLSFFELSWKPKSWTHAYRFIVVKSKVAVMSKEPVQLDLFTPSEFGFDYKVIVTNKKCSAKKVIQFHNGRGSQEGIFAEMKSENAMDIIPYKRVVANQLHLTGVVLAHNLCRSFQMSFAKRERNTTEKRTPLWIFNSIDTLRRAFLYRAGRITHPKGRYSLTISGDEHFKEQFVAMYNQYQQAA